MSTNAITQQRQQWQQAVQQLTRQQLRELRQDWLALGFALGRSPYRCLTGGLLVRIAQAAEALGFGLVVAGLERSFGLFVAAGMLALACVLRQRVAHLHIGRHGLVVVVGAGVVARFEHRQIDAVAAIGLQFAARLLGARLLFALRQRLVVAGVDAVSGIDKRFTAHG